MTYEIFSIYDSKLGAYNAPFFRRSKGEAERDFARLAQEANSNIAQFPEDFDLFYLGTFDDRVGKTELEPSPKHVIKAATLKQTM